MKYNCNNKNSLYEKVLILILVGNNTKDMILKKLMLVNDKNIIQHVIKSTLI